ncbi:Eco29kI family restriction endonuclease [Amycolatopsis keratiniphila]|uniref:Eco29kI family restriction endonuclease n=1 Tax=Amycolatopsis keratiniphila TaxID=129921 RepID=UPI0009DDEA95|nr:Eco29kI family restriction endonuclease [Amycolatopsis keratiniphila]
MTRKLEHLPKPRRFNPLDPAAIGTLLRERLEQEQPHSFPPAPFRGAGLYALYYIGARVAEYRPLTEAFTAGHQIPVYVGKAAAGNSNYGQEPDYDNTNLYDRIAKHAKSVSEVENSGIRGNLALKDFRVKFLCLDDAWIVLGERALLRAYRPVLWNTIVNGFGSNEPGTARANARSVWDTMHPGRGRAGPLPHRGLTLDEMKARVAEGVRISLISDNESRDARLDALPRPSTIWVPAKKLDPDKRIWVRDEDRFLSEVKRMGLATPQYRTDSTMGLPFDDEE